MPEGQHLRAAAAAGNPHARAALANQPPLPEALSGLWRMFLTLHGMRRIGMQGAEPLGPEAILAADQLFDWDLQPYEVDALHLLDLVTLHPEVGEEPG